MVQVQSTPEIREGLRLNVPAPSAKDVFIGGHELATGASLGSALPDLHRN